MTTVSHGQSLAYEPPSSSASPLSSNPARGSHYRPFSTLYTESPYIEIRKSFKRHSSFGGLQSLAHMGIGFKDKAKAKTNLSRVNPQVSDPTQVKMSTPPQFMHPHHNVLQRPSTTSSEVINPTPTIRRLKKKRSMVSLLQNPSASSASESVPPSQGPRSRLSPQSTDIPISSGVSASVSKKTRSADEYVDDYNSSEKFVPKNVWAKRHNMKIHPYHQDVPYMQAYDPILLDSDRYSDLLLQRLTHGSPSFHDYGKKPPAKVLDLGCGPGHWALHAATVWKTAQVTGLDIVDVTLPGFETTENANFVLGDFLSFELPFPDHSFDYVRMANLVLCIPYDEWHYVLTQVHRVLTVNGRLELIDDQIFFPYSTGPKLASFSWSRNIFEAFDDADFDDDKETLQGSGSDTGSTLNASEPSNSSCGEKPIQIAESPTLCPIASYQSPTPVDRTGSSYLSPDAVLDHHISWHSHATASRELESIFEIMLKQRYRIFPRPSDFVLDRMERVFGRGAAGKTRSYHIKLAPVDLAGQGKADGEDAVNLKSNGLTGHFDGFSKAWMGVGEKSQKKKKEKKLKNADKDNSTSKADTSTGSGSGSSSERSSLENSISGSCPSVFIPTPVRPSTSMKGVSTKEKAPSPPLSPPDQAQAPLLSAKAAGRLGISYSDLAAATVASMPRSSTSPSPLSPVQSPGLLVWPSTFIPLSPVELEMHANKYVHTLLGCKPAMAEFVSQFADEDGTRFVDDDEFHDAMWKYECFRRSRFNWPSEIPDPYDDDEPTAVPSTLIYAPPLKSRSGSKLNKNSSDSSYSEDGKELTHIRTIRVFGATKLDDRSLASLLFHQKTPPTS